MGWEIPDKFRDVRDGTSGMDTMTIVKMFQIGNVDAIQNSVPFEVMLQGLHALSHSNIKRIQEPTLPSELTDMLYAYLFGVRERASIPNIWQGHLLRLLIKSGYSKDVISEGIRQACGQNHEDILRVFNMEARANGMQEIFSLGK